MVTVKMKKNLIEIQQALKHWVVKSPVLWVYNPTLYGFCSRKRQRNTTRNNKENTHSSNTQKISHSPRFLCVLKRREREQVSYLSTSASPSEKRECGF